MVGSSLRRREALAAVVLLPTLLTPPSSFSEPSTVYTDPLDGFTITVPEAWLLGGDGTLGPDNGSSDPRSRYSNAAGLQRIVAWVPPAASDVSLAVTVRTPSADFTSLGSFGTASDFGEHVVSMLDRSYLLRSPAWVRRDGEEITTAKLLEAKESAGRYIIEYTVSKEGAPTRIVTSAVAMGTSPKGLRRFFTVNGSCTAEQHEKFGAAVRTAVESFQPPAL